MILYFVEDLYSLNLWLILFQSVTFCKLFNKHKPLCSYFRVKLVQYATYHSVYLGSKIIIYFCYLWLIET